MSIEEDINNRSEYTNLSIKAIKSLVESIIYAPNKERELILYTGLYGMYSFEFYMGDIGNPNNYVHHGTPKYTSKTERYIYITLGHKSNNIKCKIKMWKGFCKIEVMNGTNTLFFANHFNDVYKELRKRNITILIYNKFKRIFESE